jgi:hypothetical protein
MIPRTIARLARMDRRELRWRTRARAQTAIDRLRTRLQAPAWERTALAPALAPLPALAGVRADLAAGRWTEAHRRLSDHFASSPQRFLISAATRPELATRIRREFPHSAEAAAAAGDRILRGAYDLLGYQELRFRPAPPAARAGHPGRADPEPSPAPDWHHDPVHDRVAPREFWSAIRYLDPACGDHKIIWELNRHQHWLVLGRAFWLTGHSTYRERCLAELASWLENNPPFIGINWASMLELGFRSLSWIWALHFFVDPTVGDQAPWTVDLLVALERQLTHIEQNLSYYFSPNTHLLGEALALYVAGRSLPELAASDRRQALGRAVLVGEMSRQIAADGGHCERSTHYQRYALDFYLLALAIARISNDPALGDFERAAARLATAARVLADDDGQLPRIGDDDGGTAFPLLRRTPYDIRDSLAVSSALLQRSDLAVGPPPEEALWLLAHPVLAPLLERVRVLPAAAPPRSCALADTGYYVSRSARGDHLVMDGGPHGYANGGHAHADALSLTLTVGGTPLLIDPGTGCYSIDAPLRDRMRSSSLHNTLVLDGRSQSRPGGPFHWIETTDARPLRWRTNRAFDYFVGAHDGYGPAEHRRHVLVLHGDLLVVADLVCGSESHTAAVHWHLDPRWTASVSDRRVQLASPERTCQLVVPEGSVERFVADPETGLGWNAPIYGRVEACTTLRITARGRAPFWIVSVFGLDEHNPVSNAELVPVEADMGVLTHAVGIRVVRDGSVEDALFAESALGGAATWRMGAIETDAHLFFCRTSRGQQRRDIGIVDGSLVRAPGCRLVLPQVVPDLYLDNLCAA